MCNPNENSIATSKVKISNERILVTEWRFPEEGVETGWHVHEHDYVIVPLFTGCLKIDTEAGGVERVPLQNGEPYFREKGVKHNVINGNAFECSFVEIELIEQKRLS